jgi:segregation and condensation protein B
MGNDLFDMAVEQPRNDDVDADHGVTGSSHE